VVVNLNWPVGTETVVTFIIQSNISLGKSPTIAVCLSGHLIAHCSVHISPLLTLWYLFLFAGYGNLIQVFFGDFPVRYIIVVI